MAYQSLYRRYRPQRFAEVLGQEHVSTALRNAVRTGKASHAYLCSGPRGTGKTSMARILAKALNCTNVEDGEPCGECLSCQMVVAGTSMDVTELDAASNNGVDAMRDLVARAALGTSGRHRVFIVDEVHMLSTAASNALLKTLEEPPEHVVFVLATTDPQKVLPTIKSRTQHYEFRLLSEDLLTSHLRTVAVDAGIDIDEETLVRVARKGNGSARDALSALDTVAAAGGLDDNAEVLAGLVEGLIARDSARLLANVAAAAGEGRDARQLTRDLLERLRQVFLCAMAPGMNATSDVEVIGWARAFGPAALVRTIETLGATLVDMRDALDARITLEVALMRLAHPNLDTTPAALLERVERLERRAVATAGVASEAPTGRATELVQTGLEQPARAEQPVRADQPGARPPGQTTATTFTSVVAQRSGALRGPGVSSPESTNGARSGPEASDADSRSEEPRGAEPRGGHAGQPSPAGDVIAQRDTRAAQDLNPKAADGARAALAAMRGRPSRPTGSPSAPSPRPVPDPASQRVVPPRSATPAPDPVRDRPAPAPSVEPDYDEYGDLDAADIASLPDAPNVPVSSALDHLTRAFPGAELVEE